MSSSSLTSYFNPILPGWHSDPSCIYVPEHETFYCATSTFLLTPGVPVYASKDLINWKLISHAMTRKEQVPDFLESVIDQSCGIYAPTLRYHRGKFYLVVIFVFGRPQNRNECLIFSTSDPYTSSWSIPFKYNAEGLIDPDLFWDDAKGGGQAYLASTNINLRTVNLETGELGPRTRVWEGTGGIYPEGPHIYWKDDYYYLLIGEGGTELGHAVMMARAKDIWGPYEANPSNPILTARGTDHYFQTVGHADFFQDQKGQWWATALATRSGPEWKNYPLGRETILTPVEWPQGEWPRVQEVFGETALKSGRQLPPRSKDIEGGSGPWLGGDDDVDFTPGSQLPSHFYYWRWQREADWTISPPEKEETLRLKPSKEITSATGDVGRDGISVLLRLQSDTLFTYHVDVDFAPEVEGEEAGVTAWLTQSQHVDLGIVALPSKDLDGVEPHLEPHLRLRGATFTCEPYAEKIEEVVKVIPKNWANGKIRLQIQARSDLYYTFSALLVSDDGNASETIELGDVHASVLSGGSGKFSGTLVGLYATSNGGQGTTPAYFSKWRYKRDGQKIDHDKIVPSW